MSTAIEQISTNQPPTKPQATPLSVADQPSQPTRHLARSAWVPSRDVTTGGTPFGSRSWDGAHNCTTGSTPLAALSVS